MNTRAVVWMSLALLLSAKAVAAADYLSSAQMDRVTAGQLLGIECPNCTLSSSNSTSLNGVTMSTSGSSSTGSGGTGSSSGGTSGNSGGGGSGGPNIGVVQVPANLTAIITTATNVH